MSDFPNFPEPQTANPMPFDTFVSQIKAMFPDSESEIHGDQIAIHTGLLVREKDGMLFVEPKVEVPDNVIEISRHPKFQPAHYDEDGEIIPSHIFNMEEDDDIDD